MQSCLFLFKEQVASDKENQLCFETVICTFDGKAHKMANVQLQMCIFFLFHYFILELMYSPKASPTLLSVLFSGLVFYLYKSSFRKIRFKNQTSEKHLLFKNKIFSFVLFLSLNLIIDFNFKTIATHTHQAIVFFPLCALPLFPLGIQRGFIKTAQRRGSQQQHTHKWQHPKRKTPSCFYLYQTQKCFY